MAETGKGVTLGEALYTLFLYELQLMRDIKENPALNFHATKVIFILTFIIVMITLWTSSAGRSLPPKKYNWGGFALWRTTTQAN